MTTIGTLRTIRRHPVKSMAGEVVPRAIVAHAGLVGDRAWAFTDAAGPAHFPWFTARTHAPYITWRASYAEPARTLHDEALEAAWARGSGVAPALPDDTAFAVRVMSPGGTSYAVDDPRLRAELEAASGCRLALRFATRGMQDCRPVSLVTSQTIAGFAAEAGIAPDAARFRMNLEIDWPGSDPFAENALVGRRLAIGPRLQLAIVEPDARCAMISLDPATGTPDRLVLRRLADHHQGNLGLYAAVLREGVATEGNEVRLLD
jgi:uncharacterized protein YcbX